MNERLKPEIDELTVTSSPIRAVVVSPPRAPVVPLAQIDNAVAPFGDTVAPLGNLAKSLQHYIDNRLLVVSVLLLVGPLGLPLVWLNRRFSKWSKIGWTVGFVLFTVVLPIALTWYWCNTAMQPLLDAFVD